MRRAARLGLLAGALLAVLGLAGPYEAVPLSSDFDTALLDQGVSNFLTRSEANVPDLRPNSAKHVVWAGQPEQQTEWSIVYFHGFSASLQELRPVPDDVARALGANVFFTRLAGHGRNDAAMSQASATAWMDDAAEAMAIGRRIGKKVLLMSTSTGGALATLVAADPDLSQDVAALAFVSPNYQVRNRAASLLTLPAARVWVPLIAGKQRGFEPLSEAHAEAWTENYPTVATVPMAALAQAARRLDHQLIEVPALFIYVPTDKVVRAEVTDRVRSRWGGPTTQFVPVLGAKDDPTHHVIGGDILSPDATPSIVDAITEWVAGL